MDDFTYYANQQKYILKEGIPYDKSRYPKPGYWKFEDIDKNGEITNKDREVIGNANPKLYGGMTNTLTWKGFDLSIFLNFSIGNKANSNGNGWGEEDYKMKTIQFIPLLIFCIRTEK